jgi:hypothetical protein
MHNVAVLCNYDAVDGSSQLDIGIIAYVFSI